MNSLLCRGAAISLALLLADPALSQSKDDIAAKIESALPSTGRGQITGASLRDVLKTFNGARNQPGGIADLDVSGKISINNVPPLDNAIISGTSLANALSGKAPIDSYGSVASKAISVNGPATVNNQGYIDFFTNPPETIATFSGAPINSYTGYGGGTRGDFQRSNFLIRTPSVLDGTKAEIPAFINYAVNTGKLPFWANNTYFAAGTIVNNLNQGNLYKARNNGTTSATGIGPAGTGPGGDGTAIQDGTVVWDWVAYGQVDAKIGLTVETLKGPNAGNTWSFVNNLIMNPSAPLSNSVGAEFDLGNFSGECNIDGQSFCTPMFFFGHTNFISTAAMVVSTGAHESVKAYHFGIWFQRAANGNLVKDATIADDTSSDIGIGFGQSAGRLSKHSVATIRDLSDSNVGLFMAGHYANSVLNTEFADIDGNGGLAVAIALRENHGLCFNKRNACFVHDPSQGKTFYVIDNIAQMSIDNGGNIRTRGTVTPSVTP